MCKSRKKAPEVRLGAANAKSNRSNIWYALFMKYVYDRRLTRGFSDFSLHLSFVSKFTSRVCR